MAVCSANPLQYAGYGDLGYRYGGYGHGGYGHAISSQNIYRHDGPSHVYSAPEHGLGYGHGYGHYYDEYVR